MVNKPETILKRWIEYVNKLDVDRVVQLYGETSTLLPTFSPHCFSTPGQIKEYFTQLATRQNMRVDLHAETVKLVELDGNKYILMGIYSFHFIVDGANLTFPSRFTFVLDTSREKPIIHHQSSQIPRTLS